MCISLEGDTFYFTACVHFTGFLLAFVYILFFFFLGGKNDTLFLIHWFIAYSIYTVVYDFVLMCLIFSWIMSFMLSAYIIDHDLCLYGFIQCFVFGFDYLESMQPKFSCWIYYAIYVFIIVRLNLINHLVGFIPC